MLSAPYERAFRYLSLPLVSFEDPSDRDSQTGSPREPKWKANIAMGSAIRRFFAVVTVSGLCVMYSVAAGAQDIRPGDQPLVLPPFQPPESGSESPLLPPPVVPDFVPPAQTEGDVLPRLILPKRTDTDGVEAGTRVRIEKVVIRGNSVLSSKVLDSISLPFLNRPLSFADLETLRNSITLAYIERGYVTSGALIPDQSFADGVLEIQVVEGMLSAIEIETDGRLAESYLRKRIQPGGRSVVSVPELTRRLQILQQDDRIRKVVAVLEPTGRRGVSTLRVRVAEARAWHIGAAANNYSSASIGGWRGEIALAHRNLTGFGDTLVAEYEASEGLNDVSASYDVPVNGWGTAIGIYMRRTWSKVVEKPFNDLNIKANTQTYGIRVVQPLYQSPRSLLEAYVMAEHRQSQSYLLGEPFSFAGGSGDARVKESVIRLGVNWSAGSRNQALALRSLFSIGLDVLDATSSRGDRPDGQFFAWLGQAQFAQRVPTFDGVRILARFDVQITNRPLLALEQFVVGGRTSVRGYRENQLVRDNGLSGSLELLVPVPLGEWLDWRPTLDLATFVDAGYSWNTDRPTGRMTTLVSVGLGAQIGLTERLHMEVYWAHPLKSRPGFSDASLQEHGITLGITWSL